MTAMNLYLADARMLDARRNTRSHGEHSERPSGQLIAEIMQVLKGAIMPASRTQATLGDSLSRDLGLR